MAENGKEAERAETAANAGDSDSLYLATALMLAQRKIETLTAELAAEREACAKVAEEHRAPKGVPQIDYDDACTHIADAIRERTAHD